MLPNDSLQKKRFQTSEVTNGISAVCYELGNLSGKRYTLFFMGFPMKTHRVTQSERL